jgi:hypothetical protein
MYLESSVKKTVPSTTQLEGEGEGENIPEKDPEDSSGSETTATSESGDPS